MKSKENLIIAEDGSIDFNEFNKLNESAQMELLATFNTEQRMAYYMQNTISEEECFAPVMEYIDELEKEEIKLEKKNALLHS